MSNRESLFESEIHSWKGINQRVQPTLVQEGFVTDARGCFFGLGENAERIPGKKLAGFLAEPIFVIFPFQDIVLIQTMNNLYWIPKIDLLEFDVSNTPISDQIRMTEDEEIRITEDGQDRITE